MIKNDPEVNKKALELVADATLNEEQRSAQLKDFIRMKNDQTLDYLTSSIKKNQKKPRKPTEAQMIAQMKQSRCKQAGWKMYQFKGMSYAEIKFKYFTAYRRNTQFAPMGSEKEAEWIKRHAENM